MLIRDSEIRESVSVLGEPARRSVGKPLIITVIVGYCPDGTYFFLRGATIITI